MIPDHIKLLALLLWTALQIFITRGWVNNMHNFNQNKTIVYVEITYHIVELLVLYYAYYTDQFSDMFFYYTVITMVFLMLIGPGLPLVKKLINV